jgi:hypothetical protein
MDTAAMKTLAFDAKSRWLPQRESSATTFQMTDGIPDISPEVTDFESLSTLAEHRSPPIGV